MTLPAVEFLRRFLLHVLPKGFVRIRHFGLGANCHRRAQLDRCRQLLSVASPETSAAVVSADVSREPPPAAPTPEAPVCAHCGQGRWVLVEHLPGPARGELAGRVRLFDAPVPRVSFRDSS